MNLEDNIKELEAKLENNSRKINEEKRPTGGISIRSIASS